MLVMISLFVIVTWYIITDIVGSKQPNYSIPKNCCVCGSVQAIKKWTVKRSWFFGGNDIFDQFFPTAFRETELSLCESCFEISESNKHKRDSISKWISYFSFLPITYLLFYVIKPVDICRNSEFSFGICVGTLIFVLVVLGLGGSVLLFLSVPRVVEIVFNISSPARFTLLGKLRFSNLQFQKQFELCNPNSETYLPQKAIPNSIFMAVFFIMMISVLGDMDTFINGHRAIPPNQVYPINYFLIVLKIVAGFLAFRLKISTVIMLVFVILFEIFLNPNFSFIDKFEEISLIGALIIILLYEWSQTIRDKSIQKK